MFYENEWKGYKLDLLTRTLLFNAFCKLLKKENDINISFGCMCSHKMCLYSAIDCLGRCSTYVKASFQHGAGNLHRAFLYLYLESDAKEAIFCSAFVMIMPNKNDIYELVHISFLDFFN